MTDGEFAKPVGTLTTSKGQTVEIYDYSSSDDESEENDVNDWCYWCELYISEYEGDAFFYEPNKTWYCKDCFDFINDNE
jgi:hypothetical protein